MNKTALLIVSVVSLCSATARAQDEMESGRVIAVEQRPFRMVHEFAVGAGILPMDALYKGFSLGGSYTLHLTDLWSWEAIDFHYSADVDSGTDVTLARRWSVAPTNQPQIQYLAASHVIFSPLFGKLAFFNRAILYAEAFLSFGGGIAHFTDGFRPQLSVGPGIRLFLSQRVSTRLDVRDSIAPNIPSGVSNILQITFSVAFNFGSVRATEVGQEEEKDTTTGFETLDELYPASNPQSAKKARASAESKSKAPASEETLEQ
jgi:outer membrane beta-barrel protein